MMKNLILVLCIAILYSCDSQSPMVNKKIKKQSMEYFNIDKYKDWELDPKYSSDETSKKLKKGNDRVQIDIDEDDISVEITNELNHYALYKSYFPNKSLKVIGRRFYNFYIGKWQIYDESGKLAKKDDEDAPYKFSVEQLITKIKKEYGADIEKKTDTTVVDRWTAHQLNKKPLYSVSLRDKENLVKWDYILVDGSTGETLFASFFYLGDETTSYPFGRYLESLEKQEAEENSYYKTYKGKDYTKKEWEVFEEEWHKNYEENKNKGFWDDIFKKPGKK